MTQSPRLRAIIVDDESLARRRIRDLLVPDPEIEVVGECANGPQALRALADHEPDLMFLDIQMPEMDGFAVLRAIPRRHVPVIVFVTAHDRYALSAFEASAVDYVLKPFNRARFLQAVGRAKIFCSGANAAGFRENIAHLLSADSRLKVRSGRGVQLIPLSEIDWIEAANNHACVHCSLTTHIVRETLRSLETRLGSGQFARIHRSIIVNLSSVREVRPAVNGDALVVLGDGTQLPASRTFSENLAPLLSSG